MGGPTSPYLTLTPPNPTQTFTVRLNFSQLLNQSISQAYRFDPRTEPVTVTITNFGAYHTTNPDNEATLQNITFWKMDPTRPNPRFTRIPFSYDTIDSGLYTLHINGTLDQHSLKPNVPVESSISLVLNPAATSLFTLDQNSILDIRFAFENTAINGTYDYDNDILPPLSTGVLEVAIW